MMTPLTRPHHRYPYTRYIWLGGLAGIAIPSVFKGRNVFTDPVPEAIYSTIGYGETDSHMGPNGGRGDWYGDRGWPRRSCVRTARHRLDKNMRIDGHPPDPKDEDIFLADVTADPHEITNLANDSSHTDVVKRLSAMLDEHAKGAVEVSPSVCSAQEDRRNRRRPVLILFPPITEEMRRRIEQ